MSRVLLVDDEKNVLMTLSIGLKRHGFTVEKAQSGPVALQMLENASYDFMVSDLRMVPMDGYTLAEKVHAKYPDISIILMSAYGFPAKRHKQGFLQLTKPFEMADLANLLKQESKTRENKSTGDRVRILVAELDAENPEVLNHLREQGYEAGGIDPKEDYINRIKSFSPDLFLIEDSFFADDGWRLLNEIEKIAPEKPVLVLVNRSRSSDYPEMTSELSLAYLDRDRFFDEEIWFKNILHQYLN